MRPLTTQRAAAPKTDALRALRRSARRKRHEAERVLAAQRQLEHAQRDHEGDRVELETQLAETRQLAQRLTEEAIERLHQFCKQAPGSRSVRSELADLCWRMLGWAEAHDDHRRAARYLELLSCYDDGRYVDLIEGTATLELDSDPDGAEITIYPLLGGALGAPRQLGVTPLPPTDLAPGSYLIELAMPGFAPTRRPLTLKRGSDVQLQIMLFREREIGASFAYVPAGDVAAGLRQAFVDNFAIARSPVTFNDYRRFLDAIADEDPGRALAFAPRAVAAADPRDPVTGVSAEAAEAYCRWLSRERGVALRLPTAIERQKAAARVGGLERSTAAGLPQIALASADRDSLYGAHGLESAEWTAEQLEDTHELMPPILGFRVLRELPSGGLEQTCEASVPDALDLEDELGDDDRSDLDVIELDASALATQDQGSPTSSSAPRSLATVVPIGRARAGPR